MKKLLITLILFAVAFTLFGQPTGGANSIILTGEQIRYTGTPTITNANDAASKSYVDALITPGEVKNECDAATTGNITLSGEQTIDGYSAVAGDRLLVRLQTNPEENGVYVVATGSWARATDLDAWAELYRSSVFILNGTENSGTTWTSNMASTGTLNTDDIFWNKTGQIVLPDLSAYDITSIQLTPTKRILIQQGTSSDSTGILPFFTNANETDPIFTESLANDITAADTTRWGSDVSSTNELQTIVGDVTSTGTTILTTTIANDAVSNVKAANMAVNTIKGRATSGTGDPEDLTATQVKNILSLGNVENTQLSTWPGSTNITAVGTVTTGTWNANVIPDSKITKTGDWTGTFDSQEGSYYLNYNNLSNKPSIPALSDAVYGPSWDGNTTDAASKNSIFDKIESLSLSAGSTHNIGSHADASFSSLANNNILQYNGTYWVNRSLLAAGIQPAGSYLTSEVDGSITNEGLLSTGGVANAITITSNTSTSPVITLSAGANMNIYKTGNNILFASTGEPAISKSFGYLTFNGSVWVWKNEAYSLSSHTHSGYESTITKGTGFLKYNTSTGLWSWDNNAYSTTSHNHASLYQPLDGDLTSIAASSSGDRGYLKKIGDNQWVTDNTTFISSESQSLTGDVTSTGTSVLTTTIGDNKILERHLKAVNSPTDEYYLTYESTTGDFEWQALPTYTLPTASNGVKGGVRIYDNSAGGVKMLGDYLLFDGTGLNTITDATTSDFVVITKGTSSRKTTIANLLALGGSATNLSYTSSATTGIVNSDTGNDATIPASTQSIAGLMTAADKLKLDLSTTVTTFSYFNMAAANHCKLNVGANVTINISNPSDLKTGNIEITYSGTSVITFAIPSSYTLYISGNIYNSTTNAYTKSVLSKSSGKAVYSYFVSGTNIYINGTQTYN